MNKDLKQRSDSNVVLIKCSRCQTALSPNNETKHLRKVHGLLFNDLAKKCSRCSALVLPKNKERHLKKVHGINENTSVLPSAELSLKQSSKSNKPAVEVNNEKVKGNRKPKNRFAPRRSGEVTSYATFISSVLGSIYKRHNKRPVNRQSIEHSPENKSDYKNTANDYKKKSKTGLSADKKCQHCDRPAALGENSCYGCHS